VVFTHTEVAQGLDGNGLAARLVRESLDKVRAKAPAQLHMDIRILLCARLGCGRDDTRRSGAHPLIGM
jgi:hypothetical protein